MVYEPESDPCIRCGAMAEGGYVIGTGRGTTKLGWRTGRIPWFGGRFDRLDVRFGAPAQVLAYRCTACRLIYFEY